MALPTPMKSKDWTPNCWVLKTKAMCYLASVEFSGMIREEHGAGLQPFP